MTVVPLNFQNGRQLETVVGHAQQQHQQAAAEKVSRQIQRARQIRRGSIDVSGETEGHQKAKVGHSRLSPQQSRKRDGYKNRDAAPLRRRFRVRAPRIGFGEARRNAKPERVQMASPAKKASSAAVNGDGRQRACAQIISSPSIEIVHSLCVILVLS
jgi:hypothetical protein